MIDEKDKTMFYCQSWQLGGSWLSTASMLKRAADNILVDYKVAYKDLNDQISRKDIETVTLDPNLDLYCPYMLLMGYALENIIKGMIVCATGITDPSFNGVVNFADFRAVNRETGKPWSIDQHGFINLLKSSVIKEDLFSDEEMDMMQYLDKIVIWGGRYPVAKKYDPSHPHDLVCVEPIVSPLETIENIYDKAIKELFKLFEQ
jgi:hypothetical protein